MPPSSIEPGDVAGERLEHRRRTFGEAVLTGLSVTPHSHRSGVIRFWRLVAARRTLPVCPKPHFRHFSASIPTRRRRRSSRSMPCWSCVLTSLHRIAVDGRQWLGCRAVDAVAAVRAEHPSSRATGDRHCAWWLRDAPGAAGFAAWRARPRQPTLRCRPRGRPAEADASRSARRRRRPPAARGCRRRSAEAALSGATKPRDDRIARAAPEPRPPVKQPLPRGFRKPERIASPAR